MAAITGSITVKLGTTEHVLPLLSAEDLVELTGTIPSNGEIIDISSLDKWTKHPAGCDHFLFKSASKKNPSLKISEVKKWGSILGRTQAASSLFIKSILNGEEDPDPKAAGGEETGGWTPPSSPAGAPDLGTRGNSP